MPLTEKGEKIKAAMEEHYGKEKGESVFYASENKGNISGIKKGDAMPCDPEKMKKLDALMDAYLDDYNARKARRDSEFEEAKHPRQAGGVFAPKGEEGEEEEKSDNEDCDEPLRTGALSKSQ